MQQAISSYKNADGQKIHTIQWMPDGEPKAIVILVHGIVEHSGRYPHVAQALTDRGYAVYSLDHRGHGLSEGVRAHFDSMQQPVDDLKQYFDSIKAANPGKKIFMYGHSMGSLISMLFVLKYQDQLAGWVTTGTPINVDKGLPAPLISVGKLLAKIAPKMYFAPFNASGVSRDPAVVKAYVNDPLVFTRPTRVGIAAAIILTGQQEREHANAIKLPTIVLHGSADPICPVSGSHYLYEHVGSTDKTLKIYDGLYHEIHNEPEQNTVLKDIADWLDAH